MTNHFLSVTDLELIAAQLVKIVLLAILIFGFAYNLYIVFKGGIERNYLRAVIAVVLLVLSAPLVRWINIDGNLLSSPGYTIGRTIGFCQAFAKGKAIEFEYEVKGQKYKNCNTYHPIPIGDIIVPNGKYWVRYSKKYPETGRINFKKPVE